MDPGRDLFSPTPSSPVDRIRMAYNRAFVNWQAYWVEAYRDQSFYLNNQWTPEERRYLQQEQRPDYSFNLTRAVVNMVQGYQRKHRHSIICQAVENSSSKTADIMTKCIYHSMRSGKGHYAVSDAFKGALTTGIGFIGLSMDYRFDPLNGDPVFTFYPWNSIIADPFWSQQDFSDCDYLIRRAYMSKEEAISRFPDKESMLQQMQGNMRDELFTFLPQQRIFQSQNLLAYTEYWEQQYKEVTAFINPVTLQEIEVNKDNREQFNLIKDIPGVKSYKKQKRVIKFTAMINNELVHEDENPYNLDEYPFIPVVAVYEPEYDLYQYKLQSLIRCVRDPQINFNQFISKITDSFNSQINNGWIVKKSRFDNPLDFYKTGQGRVIYAKTEADLMGDARQIESAGPPNGIFEMQNIFNQLIMRICGVNEELLAAADDDKAGVLAMLRQGAALVNLQDLFDKLRMSEEILGNRLMKMIQRNWTPEKVFLVTKEQPTPEFYSGNFGKYDCITAEAPLTETQQQLFFTQLMQFKEMGAPLSWGLLLENYPGQGMQEIIEDVKAQEQQQAQMQQAMAQAEMQDKAVVNDLLIKEGLIKIASAKEKLAKAEDDKALAVFHRAQAVKELEKVDLENINTFIDTILKIESLDSLPEQLEEAKEEVQNVR
jgi:hypothetical protein